MRLRVDDHDRDRAGLRYVYPVVSRRAGGVSVGINLNPNNACNFRCIYCQVPDLVYGKAPAIDRERLEAELASFLDDLVNGDYMERMVPEGSRRLNDLAFSGNGEPTSAADFDELVKLVGTAMRDFRLLPQVKLVLITNGSLMKQESVQRGLAVMAAHNGEVWFKLDSATREGQNRINSWNGGPERTRSNLLAAARTCPTWIQTCMFAHRGEEPSRNERDAYLSFVRSLVREELPLRGVLLYGLARPSHQPEAPELMRLPEQWMETWADEIRSTGLEVRVSP